ncbi:MAG: DUF4238 domain-containing protein [Clostridiales bacterium]|nr:DUF4238 domain-containing protein [Clostridiales bacterium]
MAERKNQHFVPKVYLRSFASGENCVDLYIKSKGKLVKEASLSGQASKPYFYGKDLNIEEGLGYFENEYGKVLEKINKNIDSLLDSDLHLLAMFLFLQSRRTEAAIMELIDTSKNIQNYLSISFPNINLSQFEDINSRQNNIDLSLSVAVDLYNSCRDLSYKFLINNTSKDFITSDSPVCLYNQFHERIKRKTFAFNSIGTQIFFPLTPRISFLLYDNACYKVGTRKSISVILNNAKDIDTLNAITYINANEVIYFRNRGAIGNFTYLDKISNNPSKHETIPIDNKTGVFHTSNQPPLCKANLSFIKETDLSKVIKVLPESYPPLLRKYCTDFHRKEIKLR